MSEQDSIKSVYRRVLRKFHPDMTRCPEEKIALGELTRLIIGAYERGDGEMLLEIAQLGLVYSRPIPPSEPSPVEEPHRAPSCSPVDHRSAAKHWARIFLPLCFPYSLAFAVRSWNENGKVVNCFCLGSAMVWGWIALCLWDGVSGFAAWLTGLGYEHESFAGLAIVLIRGGLFAAMLPIMVPLGLVALRVGWLLGAGWVAHWVLAEVLGFFHPYLEWVATLGVGTAVAVAVWRSLDDW